MKWGCFRFLTIVAAVINRPRNESFSGIIHGCAHESPSLQNNTTTPGLWHLDRCVRQYRASGEIVLPKTHRVDGVDEFSGLAELHETLPQVVERTFHQDLLLLVVVQKVIPQRLLGQGLRVSHNDHTISVPRAQNNERLHKCPSHYMETHQDLCSYEQMTLWDTTSHESTQR